MKLSSIYNSSKTKRVCDFLFVSNMMLSISETRLGKLFGFNSQAISDLLIIIASVSVIYQAVLPVQLKVVSPILLILAILVSDKKKIRISKPMAWLLGMYFIVSVSLLIAIFSGLNPRMLLQGLFLWFQFGLYLIAGMTFNVKWLYKIVTFMIVPISIYGIYQYFTTKVSTTLWVSEWENIPFRAYSIVRDPNIFGMISLVALVAVAVLIVQKKYYYCLLVPVFTLAIGLSYSRTTWLAAVVVAIVTLLVISPKYLKFMPLSLVLLAIPKVRDRVFVTFTPQFLHTSSVDGRIWILNNVLHLWRQRPILGYGPGSYGGETAVSYASPVYLQGVQHGYVPIYYTDSQWLQVVVQFGILGILTLVGFIVSSFTFVYSGWKKTRNPIFLGGIMIILFLVTTGFSSNIIEFGTIIIPSSLLLGGALSEA